MPTRRQRMQSRELAENLHEEIRAGIVNLFFDPEASLRSQTSADLSRLMAYHHVWEGRGEGKQAMVKALFNYVYSKYVTPKTEKEALEIAAKSGDPVAAMALHDYEEEHK